MKRGVYIGNVLGRILYLNNVLFFIFAASGCKNVRYWYCFFFLYYYLVIKRQNAIDIISRLLFKYDVLVLIKKLFPCICRVSAFGLTGELHFFWIRSFRFITGFQFKFTNSLILKILRKAIRYFLLSLFYYVRCALLIFYETCASRILFFYSCYGE